MSYQGKSNSLITTCVLIWGCIDKIKTMIKGLLNIDVIGCSWPVRLIMVLQNIVAISNPLAFVIHCSEMKSNYLNPT